MAMTTVTAECDVEVTVQPSYNDQETHYVDYPRIHVRIIPRGDLRDRVFELKGRLIPDPPDAKPLLKRESGVVDVLDLARVFEACRKNQRMLWTDVVEPLLTRAHYENARLR